MLVVDTMQGESSRSSSQINGARSGHRPPKSPRREEMRSTEAGGVVSGSDDGTDGDPVTLPLNQASLSAHDVNMTGDTRLNPIPATKSRATRRYGGPVRTHTDSVTENYYGNSIEVGTLPHAYVSYQETQGPITTEQPVKKSTTRQSRRLPPWIWFVLAKSLGIKLHALDKPWFGTVMHVLTLTFGFAFVITNSWYKGYDIMSEYTKETALSGMVTIVLGFFWVALGIYSNKLAGNLFQHPKFLDSVRLHSKTIFKVSSAGMMIALATSAIILNNVSTKDSYQDATCHKVALNVLVCRIMYVSRVAYSVFALLWNCLVGIVLLSVCRTHTIGIRRFIKELEEDGRVYELYRRNQMMSGPFSDDRTENIDPFSDDEEVVTWEEDASPYDNDAVFPHPPYGFHHTSPLDTPTRGAGSRHTSQTSATSHLPESVATAATHASSTNYNHRHSQNIEAEISPESASHDSPLKSSEESSRPPPKPGNKPIIIVGEGSVVTADESGERTSLQSNPDQEIKTHLIQPDPPSISSRSTRSQLDSPMCSTRVELGSSPRRVRYMVPSSIATGMTDRSVDNVSVGPHVLSVDDILLSYHKINTRLRQTSIVLQRWLIAIIMFIMLWSVTFIVYWVNHPASMMGIVEFLIPILILPIICSAYGEVNYEGRRLIRSICPTNERTRMLYFLQQQPLELSAFGFQVNYSLIVTALGALGLALITRLILDEINM